MGVDFAAKNWLPWFKALVQMCCMNELPHQVFTRRFAPSELWFHAPFWHNVAGLPYTNRDSFSDESLEELVNPSEEESPKLLFESLSCSHEQELHASAIA